MMGVPDADVEAFQRYGRALGSALDGLRSLTHAREVIRANVALEAVFEALFALRERQPRDDLVSALVHYCLGAPLARLEATIALAALAGRMPGLRQTGRVVCGLRRRSAARAGCRLRPGERTAYLDSHRQTFEQKCAGLDPARCRCAVRRPRP